MTARRTAAWLWGPAAVLLTPPVLTGQAAFAPRVDTIRLDGHALVLRAHYVPEGWVNLLLVFGGARALLVDHPGDWRTLAADPAQIRAVQAVLADLAAPPIRYLVDTHWHGDHSGGNAVYPGADVIAHARTAQYLAVRQTPTWFPDGIGPMDPSGRPSITFTDSLAIRLAGEVVHLWHFGAAHTDGDAVVYLEAAKVIHMGDLYHGLADPSFGEDMSGIARTIEAVLELVPSDTRVVTGHGGVTSLAELRRYGEMLAATIRHVEAQLKAGAPLSGIVRGGLPAPWGGTVADSTVERAWLEAIYHSAARSSVTR